MNPIPQRLGKYELKETIGNGGMAEVKKAFDTQLQRYVAIKFLRADLQSDPSFLTRFEREAQAVASLHHPHIVQIFDSHISRASDSGVPLCYMVMQYIEGQTLADFLRKTSRRGEIPPVEDILYLFTTIGHAVAYAHQRGIIHRDIKPSNILLDQHLPHKKVERQSQLGEPVLSDFGIVKLLGAPTSTLNNAWVGTPAYIAPELAMGYAGDERSDIYSLGVILYEMCTGSLPFSGENIPTIIMHHINTLPPPPALKNPNIPFALSTVIMRCLVKDPNGRFPQVMAFVDALTDALSPANNLGNNILASEQTMKAPNLVHEPSSTPVLPLVASASSLPDGARQRSSTTPSVFGLSHNSAEMARLSQPSLTSGPQAMALPFVQVKRTSHRLPGILITLAVLLLLLAGLSSWLLFLRPPGAGSSVVGHAFFVSSGQISELSNQGINDELEIDLQQIPAPASGKSYYGWLEPDKVMNMTAPILLGALPFKNGTIHYLYPGDQKHTNLLASMSRFLITEESIDIMPSIPSPDNHAWRYSAAFPQPTSAKADTSDNMNAMSDLSVLAHLRHLLAEAPELKQQGLTGGLDIWLFRNTQKILEWSGSARDEWQSNEIPLMHRQIVRILDYLDGIPFVQKDAPGEPVMVVSHLGQVGLLDLSQHQAPSLLYQIDFHLNAMIQSPDVTSDQRILASQIDTNIENATGWLTKVRQDAAQLVKLSYSQLAQQAPLSLLDDMTTQSLNAFTGRVDPGTGQVQGGVIQVHYAIQHLATFTVTPA